MRAGSGRGVIPPALAARAPFGVYPGAYASRNPVFTLGPNTVVGAVDVACARFGWAASDTGEVANTLIEDAQLGVVQPVASRNWGLTYLAGGEQWIRAGKPCTLISSADLWVRFPLGGLIGSSVWTDPTSGLIYASNGGSFVLTRWQLVTDASPNGLGLISQLQTLS
jgi:hypothetical protein